MAKTPQFQITRMLDKWNRSIRLDDDLCYEIRLARLLVGRLVLSHDESGQPVYREYLPATVSKLVPPAERRIKPEVGDEEWPCALIAATEIHRRSMAFAKSRPCRHNSCQTKGHNHRRGFQHTVQTGLSLSNNAGATWHEPQPKP